MNKTFFLLKPDCLRRGIINDCYNKLISAGFIVEKSFLINLDPRIIKSLYYPFTLANCPNQFREMKEDHIVKYLSSGLIAYIKVCLNKEIFIKSSIFEFARKIQGEDYYPEQCEPGSIRYDFRDPMKDGTWIILEYIPNFGNVAGEIVYNIVHTPANFQEYQFQSEILDNAPNKFKKKHINHA